MKFKKYLTFIIAVMICITSSLYAKASSFSSWYYSDEIDRVKALNIMDATDNPESILTRGEFTKAIVIASGFDDDANLSAGPTIFSDVDPGNPYSGYVNVAVSKGLMKGALDRKYHPEGTMTFAQVCTVLISALGYTTSDLQGLWPNNYILKAKALGLANGMDLKDNDNIPQWAAAVMISRLLDTSVKKNSPSDPDKKFADISGISSDSYQLALITNPVYSKPEVASDVNAYTTSIGSINLSGDPKIIKDGQLISISQIEDNDVVYQVSDVWNIKKYILVVDNKVQGQIAGISSSGIEIAGKNYEYGSGMDLNRVLNSSGEYKVGDYITLLLGYDGKIVNFFDIEHQDNGDYAFVVNYTYDASGSTVKLLMVDGNMRTFNTSSYYGGYKGMLVKYTLGYGDSVSLTSLTYNYQGALDVDKENRMIGDQYVSHDVKIFNIVSSNVNQDQDINVNLINWSDLPSGTIDSGKILYMNSVGQFNDVNVILTSDLLNNVNKTGIVSSVTPIISNVPVTDPVTHNTTMTQVVTGHTYSIVVDGTAKSWKDSSTDSVASAGNVVKVMLSSSGSIDYIEGIKYQANSASKVDAINVSRILINGTSYNLTPNPQVYFETSSGNYVLKTISDITAGKIYSFVGVYLDGSSYNEGKVDTIIVMP